MDGDPNQNNLKALQRWAGDLACPVCLGALRIEAIAVRCVECGRTYLIVDGVAVLIAERSTSAAQ